MAVFQLCDILDFNLVIFVFAHLGNDPAAINIVPASRNGIHCHPLAAEHNKAAASGFHSFSLVIKLTNDTRVNNSRPNYKTVSRILFFQTLIEVSEISYQVSRSSI